MLITCLGGNIYARAIRTHKLTLQALWQLLLSQLYTYLDGIGVALKAELLEVFTSIDADHIAQMVDKLTTGSFRDAMKGFAAALVVENPNAELWWDYMTMVSILLCFTRAQRDGSWDIHLYYFKRMLPFLFRCDHVNYDSWGTVYLGEMSVLPPKLLHEFQEGNFVVTRTDRRIRVASTLSRWTLSYNLKTVISPRQQQC